MIAGIDARVSRQLDEILHHPEFQELESSWRSLKFLVDRTDFRENIKVQMLNVTKDELADDFDDAPETVKSGLYKHVYVTEYGQLGGEPVATIVANYEFDSSSKDIALLQELASVASMAHAPVIAGVSTRMFDIGDWSELAGDEGPRGGVRCAAVREVELVPPDRRTRATSGWPCRGSCCARRITRRTTRCARSTTRRRPAPRRRTTCGGAPRSRWPRACRRASRSTAGHRTSSARRAGARSRTCRCTSTRRWGDSTPSRRST